MSVELKYGCSSMGASTPIFCKQALEILMLAPKEKKRILAEETFREKVRQQLRKPDKKQSTLWMLVNSAFFLWFMSTIIIGLVSFSYTVWDRSREEQRRKDEDARAIEREKRLTAKKLDAEISNRLYYFGHLLELNVFSTGESIEKKA